MTSVFAGGKGVRVRSTRPRTLDPGVSGIWSQDPEVWAARLGISASLIEHMYDFSASGLPILDLAGNAPITTLIGSVKFAVPWLGRGGGQALEFPATPGGNAVETTVTDVLAPDVDDHTILISYQRGLQEPGAAARSVFAPNDLGSGTRLADRNNEAPANFIHPTFENQTNDSKNAIVQNSIGINAPFVDAAISRTATDAGELWVAEDQATTVYHEDANPVIIAADNFTEAGGVLRFGATGVGNHPPNLRLRFFIFIRDPHSIVKFDAYRRTKNLLVIEA